MGTIRWKYLLQESALILVFSLALFFARMQLDETVVWVWKGSLGVCVIFGLGWLLLGRKRPTPLGRELWIWGVVFGLTVLFSTDPRRSFSQMLLMLQAVLVFALVAETVARGVPRELVIKALLVAGGLMMAFDLTLWGFWYAQWLANNPGQWIPTVVFRVGWTVQAAMTSVMLQLAFARWCATKSRGERGVLSIYILAGAFLILAASSRGSWLGLAVGGAVQLAWMGWQRLDVVRAWIDWLRRRWWVIAGCVVGVALLGVLGLRVYQALMSTSSHAATIGEARSEFWPAAWQTFLQHPLLGSGPYTYVDAFMQFNSLPPKGLHVHAHSLPLNWLAEMGLVGAAAAAWLVLRGGLSLWKRLRIEMGQATDGVTLGVTAAVVGYGMHSLVDVFHTHWVSPCLFVVVIALGAALGEEKPALAAKPSRRPWWVLLLLAGLLYQVWAEAPMMAAVERANAGDWPSAVTQFSEAAQRDPLSGAAWAQLGVAQAYAGDVSAARQALERAARIEPYWSIYRLNFGALALAEGDLDTARTELEAAVKAAPEYSLARFNLAAFYEHTGQSDLARAEYQQALRLYPDWGKDTYWGENELRCEVWREWAASQPKEEILSEAELREKIDHNPNDVPSYRKLAELLYEQGEVVEAKQLLDTTNLVFYDNSMERERISRLKALWKGDEAAVDKIDARVGSAEFFSMNGGYIFIQRVFRQTGMMVDLTPQVAYLKGNLTTNALPEICGQP